MVDFRRYNIPEEVVDTILQVELHRVAQADVLNDLSDVCIASLERGSSERALEPLGNVWLPEHVRSD